MQQPRANQSTATVSSIKAASMAFLPPFFVSASAWAFRLGLLTTCILYESSYPDLGRKIQSPGNVLLAIFTLTFVADNHYAPHTVYPLIRTAFRYIAIILSLLAIVFATSVGALILIEEILPIFVGEVGNSFFSGVAFRLIIWAYIVYIAYQNSGSNPRLNSHPENGTWSRSFRGFWSQEGTLE